MRLPTVMLKKKKATGVGRLLAKSICRWPLIFYFWLNQPWITGIDLIWIYKWLFLSPTMPS